MKFYCQKCGIELVHTRKAVPGRGMILDLITPHECEGYSIKSDEFGNPTVEDILNNLKPLGKAKLVSGNEKDKSQSTFDVGDRRGDVKSIAPKSLLNAMSQHAIESGGIEEGD